MDSWHFICYVQEESGLPPGVLAEAESVAADLPPPTHLSVGGPSSSTTATTISTSPAKLPAMAGGGKFLPLHFL